MSNIKEGLRYITVKIETWQRKCACMDLSMKLVNFNLSVLAMMGALVRNIELVVAICMCVQGSCPFVFIWKHPIRFGT